LVDGHVVDYRLAIGVANDVASDVPNGRVVRKDASRPTAAVKAVTVITEAIIDAAVEAYRPAPVAAVPGIDTVAPAPIARGP